MSMIGTFDGFTASRLGIYAAQQSLRVVGNNISNISTAGYTRQRVDQSSFKVGVNDMYRSFYDNHVGSGALVTGINQIRDPYLDIRYRTTSTETYHYDTWLAGLKDIAAILDEVGRGENRGDGLLYAQLQDLAEKLRAFSADPTSGSDGLVRESASALAALFRNYASRLDQLYSNTEASFNDHITEVNDILVSIRDLNKSIREAEIHGDLALEMRDERNRQIDALSQYLDINVTYSFENIGAGIEVEKLTISLNNANPDKTVHSDESILVDGVYATQLSVPEQRPARNMFPEDSPYAYLNNFLYRREVAMDLDELTAFADKEGYMPEAAVDENGNPKTDAAGNTIYLIGTKDADLSGVVMEKNTNYTIQLSELTNSKGALWKSSTTSWITVTDDSELGFARREYNVSLNPGAGDKFNIVYADGSTKEFTIVDDTVPDYTPDPTIKNPVYLSQIGTDAGLAEFLAGELRKSGRYPEYNITVENGNLVFTAKNPGAVGTGSGAPSKLPELTVTNDDAGLFDITKVSKDEDEDGYLSPADADKYDEHGNVIESSSYAQVNGKLYKVVVSTQYTHKVTLDDNDLRGILQAQRELLTEEGEFSSDYDVLIDEEAAIKRGIPYYQQALDLLAQKFAEAYNELNMGFTVDKDGNFLDKDNNLLYMGGISDPVNQDKSKLTDEQKEWLIANGYFLKNEKGEAIDANGNLILDGSGNPITGNITPDNYPSSFSKIVPDFDAWVEDQVEAEIIVRPGGPLFSNGNNGNDTSGINAHNIDISAGWSHGDWGLVPKYEKIFVDENNPDGLEQSTQNTNADHMVAMIEKGLTYDPRDLYGSDATGPLLFTGSFNDFLSNMMAVEASDERITTSNFNTSVSALTELDYSREGVSGVDLNDEAMDMMQFSKAMNAAMRVMTTIDEVLDRLINNTGIAGR